VVPSTEISGEPLRRHHDLARRMEALMSDKSPRSHESKKSGKSLKEKRTAKKAKLAAKRPIK
jgi:hypothetical protein